MGAWIETTNFNQSVCTLPVAPYMGAWIETETSPQGNMSGRVAPYMGAWIETLPTNVIRTTDSMSHPTWVRGLKQASSTNFNQSVCRTLHGCVD